ncbi:hypothetical protein EG68_06451 [Paragonimus skrjabini miyazakii]|uniref:Uncharacterized protein n=1 Tax=Paragonimus skrjabini miyazakii TaxID=59628 RepID=A0A8S9YUF4_9TREM|nr:hypothetical protein EG68_06451 [Paragonimus skrjabini miyazakii]
MCDEDSDKFESADEGLDSSIKREECVPMNVNAQKENKARSMKSLTQASGNPIAVRKKKKGKSKSASKTCVPGDLKPPFATEPPKVNSEIQSESAFTSTTLDETIHVSSQTSPTEVLLKKDENLPSSPADLESLSPEEIQRHPEFEIVQQIEPEIPTTTQLESPSDDLLTVTASKLVHGLGDGLGTVAGIFSQALQSANLDKLIPKGDVTEQRSQRIADEEAERQAISQAWSNVWNTAWGLDDGWEVEEVSETVPAEDSKASELTEQGHATKTDAGCEGTSNSADVIPTVAKVSLREQDNRKVSSTLWDWTGVTSFAQQLTSSLQAKSLNLVQEGVNVLEQIGKKTMSVIEENDPGFRYTKSFLRPPGLRDRPNLSQVIREAHERDKISQQSVHDSRTAFNQGSFTVQLELRRALVHLEALELVSDQAESQLHARLDTLPASCNLTLHDGLLESIWKALQLDVYEEEEEEEVNSGENLCSTLIADSSVADILGLPAFIPAELRDSYPSGLSDEQARIWAIFEQSLKKIEMIYSGESLFRTVVCAWTATKTVGNVTDVQMIFFSAIAALAEVTSADLEYLHKMAECALVRTYDPETDLSKLASIVALMLIASMKLKTFMCAEYIRSIKAVPEMAAKDSDAPSSTGRISISQLVASLLLECSNAHNYLKNAAHLLIPVFQLACVNSLRPLEAM